MPTMRSGTYMPGTPYVYEFQVNEILITLNHWLVMLPTEHMKNQTELDHVSVTFINFSNKPRKTDMVCHICIPLLYTEY